MIPSESPSVADDQKNDNAKDWHSQQVVHDAMARSMAEAEDVEGPSTYDCSQTVDVYAYDLSNTLMSTLITKKKIKTHKENIETLTMMQQREEHQDNPG